MKESLQLRPSLEFEFRLQFPCGSLSTELSDFHQSVRSGNGRECEHVKARAKGKDVITNAISANQHLASSFSMQIFKFQRLSCKLSFLFPAPPPEHPRELARRLKGFPSPLASLPVTGLTNSLRVTCRILQ